MAALTFLQTAAEGATSTGAFPGANIAGNLIVVWVGWQTTAAGTVTDTAGNVYTMVAGWSGPVISSEATNSSKQTLYYCLSIKAHAAGNIVTVSNAYLITAFEYTVPAGVSVVLNPLAVTASNNQIGTGSTPFPLAFTLNPILSSTSELVVIAEFSQGVNTTYAGFPATFGMRLTGGHTAIYDNSAQNTAVGTLTLTANQTVQVASSCVTAGFTAGYSISGHAAPGATVSAFSTTRLAYAASATADGSGNYTITGVPDADTYTITPYAGGIFSPVSSSVTLAGANKTGVSFALTSTLVYTQMAADSGIRANENPLSQNGNWTRYIGSGEAQLELLNNQFQAGSVDRGVSIYTGVTFPSNEYFQVVLNNIAASGSSNLLAVLRCSSPTTPSSVVSGYAFRVFGPFGNGCGVGLLKQILNSVFTNYTSPTSSINNGRDNPCAIWPVNAGSVIRGECFNNQLTFLIDGIPVACITDTGNTLTTLFGIHLDAFNVAAITDVQMSFFAAGSITSPIAPIPYSVPDSRSSVNFPNLSTNVQSTLTYTTPSAFCLRWWFDTLFNRTQPLPLDSRTAGVPIDSRTIGNIPLNSRTPGTFGPGE
jgi:hypothetical protein